MTQEQIIEGNKLILAFMGEVNIYTDKGLFNLCGYHDSWDWLMPVVEKIKSMSKDWPIATDVVLSLPIHTPIAEVYFAIIQFITWYNQNISSTDKNVKG